MPKIGNWRAGKKPRARGGRLKGAREAPAGGAEVMPMLDFEALEIRHTVGVLSPSTPSLTQRGRRGAGPGRGCCPLLSEQSGAGNEVPPGMASFVPAASAGGLRPEMQVPHALSRERE